MIGAGEKALAALRLYDAYVATPADRGGKTGPKGLALQAFLDAKTKALAEADAPSPGEVTDAMIEAGLEAMNANVTTYLGGDITIDNENACVEAIYKAMDAARSEVSDSGAARELAGYFETYRPHLESGYALTVYVPLTLHQIDATIAAVRSGPTAAGTDAGKARVAAEALAPFAREAAGWPELSDDDTLSLTTPAGTASAYDITMRDVRRAPAVFAALGAPAPQTPGEPKPLLERLKDWINREVPIGTKSATYWMFEIDAALKAEAEGNHPWRSQAEWARLLDIRDGFIVERGLWPAFIDDLDKTNARSKP